MEGLKKMNTLFIKIIFLFITLIIMIYSCSYANFEIVKKNNFFGGIFVFLFSGISVIFANAMFFLT